MPLTFTQEVDTAKVEKVVRLEAQLDSMMQMFRSLDNELQYMKKSMSAGKSDVDELMKILGDEEIEKVPEEQRSKSKRIDALLDAITQRPGQLRFNGGATATIQGQPSGDNKFSSGVGSFDILATTSFGNNSLLFFNLEAIGGNGPNEMVSTFAGLNDDAGSTQSEDGLDRIYVLEAWAEFSLFDESLTITAGKIDLTNYFDNNAYANDETSQFISGAFVNSAAFAVPDNSPGLRLRTTLFNRFFIQAGVASSNNSGWKIFDSLYTIGSVGFRLLQDTDWEANIRFYTYQHPSANYSAGYGVSFDETIFGKYSFFGRYGWNSNGVKNVSGISNSWSLGGGFKQNIAVSQFNIGVAYGEIKPSEQLLKKEQIAEIYAKHQMNKWVYISPHIQMVWNPAGISGRHIIYGFRTNFIF